MACFSAASVMVTDACNLHCDYCFEGAGGTSFMSEQTAERAVEFLVGETLRGGEKKVRITFFGGEPLLNLPALRTLLRHGVARAEAAGLEAEFGLITNGTIWGLEVEDFLVEWWNLCPGGFYVQVSADGLPQAQDAHRRTRDGKPTSSTVERNLRRLTALMDTLGASRELLAVHSVTTKETLPMAHESYQYFRNLLGPKAGIWPLLLHEERWAEEDTETLREQYGRIADHILLECVKSGTDAAYRGFTPMHCRERAPERPCKAGVGYCTIKPDGSIYPCHGFAGCPETQIGDLGHGVDLDRAAVYAGCVRRAMSGELACGECDNHSCRFCIATNYTKNGSLFAGFPAYCRMSRAEDEIRKALRDRLERCGVLKRRAGPRSFGSMEELRGFVREGMTAFSPVQAEVLQAMLAAFEADFRASLLHELEEECV